MKTSAVPKVAMYLRVSSDDQANRQTPIETQRDVCRRKAEALWPGVAIREFVDAGFSGTLGLRSSDDQRGGFRPDFTNLCDAIARGEITVLVVQDVDRLARKETVWFEFVNEYITRYGVKLYDAHREVDLATAQGQFTNGILSLSAAHFARLTGEKIKAAHARRRREGYSKSGRCFGWRLDDESGKAPGAGRDITPVPDEGPWVIQIKDWFLAGQGVTAIARELNARKVATLKGAPWSDSTVSKILDNPTHAGLVRNGDGDELGPGRHYDQRYYEPDEYHEIRRLHRHRNKKRQPCDTSSYILHGLATCGECGRRLVSSLQNKTRSYMCTSSGPGNSKLCSRPHCRADHLEAVVVRYLSELAGSEPMRRLLDDELKTTLDEQEKKLRKELKLRKSALEQNTGDKDRLFELYYRKRIDEHEFEERNQKLTDTKRLAEEQIEKIEGLISDRRARESQAARVKETLARFDETWEHLRFDERRRVLEMLLEAVTVSDGRPGMRAVVKPFFGPEHSENVPGQRRERRAEFGPESLSLRQLAVLALVDEGLGNEEIAKRLKIGLVTVLKHLNGIFHKLQVETVEQALEAARPIIEQFRAYLRTEGRDGEAFTDLKLSPQQEKVLGYLAKPDLDQKAIAEKMGISDGTVKYHIAQLYEKLGVDRRPDAIAKAHQLGFLCEQQMPGLDRMGKLGPKEPQGDQDDE